ncbi:MAG: hypothetical protein JNM80_04545 [Phycisphaerae bacterium]|nr:hypothetical protein [Phycisphaerae bacterium]
MNDWCFAPPPQPFPTPPDLIRVDGGYYHTTAQIEERTVFAWGRNHEYQCFVPAGPLITYSANYDHGVGVEDISSTDAFTNADGQPTLVRYSASDILMFNVMHGLGYAGADCNGDRVLDTLDYACFLARFERARRLWGLE